MTETLTALIRILVVDDEEECLTRVAAALEVDGVIEVEKCVSVADVERLDYDSEFQFCILDVRFAGVNRLHDLLGIVENRWQGSKVTVLSDTEVRRDPRRFDFLSKRGFEKDQSKLRNLLREQVDELTDGAYLAPVLNESFDSLDKAEGSKVNPDPGNLRQIPTKDPLERDKPRTSVKPPADRKHFPRTEVFTILGQVMDVKRKDDLVEVSILESDPDGTEEYRRLFMSKGLFRDAGLLRSMALFEFVTFREGPEIRSILKPRKAVPPATLTDDPDLVRLEAILDRKLQEKRAALEVKATSESSSQSKRKAKRKNAPQKVENAVKDSCP